MKSAALTAFELSFCSFLIINNPFFVKTSIKLFFVDLILPGIQLISNSLKSLS